MSKHKEVGFIFVGIVEIHVKAVVRPVNKGRDHLGWVIGNIRAGNSSLIPWLREKMVLTRVVAR